MIFVVKSVALFVVENPKRKLLVVVFLEEILVIVCSHVAPLFVEYHHAICNDLQVAQFVPDEFKLLTHIICLCLSVFLYKPSED